MMEEEGCRRRLDVAEVASKRCVRITPKGLRREWDEG